MGRCSSSPRELTWGMDVPALSSGCPCSRTSICGTVSSQPAVLLLQEVAWPGVRPCLYAPGPSGSPRLLRAHRPRPASLLLLLELPDASLFCCRQDPDFVCCALRSDSPSCRWSRFILFTLVRKVHQMRFKGRKRKQWFPSKHSRAISADDEGLAGHRATDDVGFTPFSLSTEGHAWRSVLASEETLQLHGGCCRQGSAPFGP